MYEFCSFALFSVMSDLFFVILYLVILWELPRPLHSSVSDIEEGRRIIDTPKNATILTSATSSVQVVGLPVQIALPTGHPFVAILWALWEGMYLSYFQHLYLQQTINDPIQQYHQFQFRPRERRALYYFLFFVPSCLAQVPCCFQLIVLHCLQDYYKELFHRKEATKLPIY